MKNDNVLWGCRRIAASGSWSRFLKAHWDSMYAMDFMTIDTFIGKRFFLLIVLKLSTREIKYWDMTENPTKEFVRQRIIEIMDQNPPGMYLINDNAPQFTAIDYRRYGINGINTSVAAPNMKTEESEGSGQVYLDIAELTMVAAQANAYVERVIDTIRREALDHFILLSVRQVRKTVSDYTNYYNKYRPQPGLGSIPSGDGAEDVGLIVKMPILSGLHHHYYRSSA